MSVTEQRLTARYGDPHQEAAFVARNILQYKLPDWLRPHWPRYDGKTVTSIQINRAIIPHLEAVMRDLIALGLIHELKEYGGGYNYRKQRGADALSLHAFGVALDFNQHTNTLGGRVTFSAAFLAVWRAHGWTVGADFHGKRVDGMHYEYTK